MVGEIRLIDKVYQPNRIKTVFHAYNEEESIENRYLFSWEDIPENDNVRLIEFLNRNFGIDWVKTAKIEKIDNGKTIKVSTEKNYLTLKLNDEQTEVNLEIDDGRTDKFVVKIENSKLNIYENSIQVDKPNGITAVIPAYNEEVSIGSIVLQTRRYVENVIVIDDGSNDKTAMLAQMAGAEVLQHSKNMGKGIALKTGFEAAFQKNTGIIVTIDADGQHDPSEIPSLVKPILLNETDMVNGSRYIGGKDKKTPLYRRIGQTVLDKFTNFNSGLDITDTQSGFRAFSINTITAFRFKSKGMGIESEMLADAAKARLRIKEI